MILDFLLVSFLLFALISLLFTVLNWSFLFYKDQSKTGTSVKGVSVIVCAKNEEKNLPTLLESLKNQDYPDYEIVLVNDNSYDSTLEIFEKFQKENSNVELVDAKENERFWRGKKFPLTLGIKRASKGVLLFTDADCVPKSNLWIKSMADAYTDDAEIVLGYGPYKKAKGLLNKLIRFETILTASNYFSFALALKAYMGVGRNLSYKKSLFFENNGFYSHMDVASGDDDLFVNENATRNNTKIVCKKESWVESEAEKDFKSLLRQKRRHYTTSNHYNLSSKFLLGLQAFSKSMLYIHFIALMVVQYRPETVLGVFALYFVINFITFTILSRKLDEKDLIAFFPLLEIFLIFFQPFIQISNVISKPKRWI